ncbi:5-oxoprolinase subunit PxpA [Moritella sp.]|uniref:5-oxoprolinase subunit PxpA n=1 Tax=Moritella sp. TaxID=78556 RepID=UPI001D5198C2|nr:5-oxoprolinase subunit PxpA [Moritella sp.]MCJ8348913.1 5-oxoprolinase subunit PxpA [Moritella sp.]NQZ38786.1 5-oxoprolinase subunit PxpA [Moritella sp.]
MKLNCDMGESFGLWQLGMDEAVMPHVDMANIACGFHASDPLIMQQTVALAKQYNVAVGAHPGYPDLVGFGRRHISCTPDEIQAFILYQVGALAAFCKQQHIPLSYVKPHGALYNDMMQDETILIAILKGVAAFSPGLPLMLMAQVDNRRSETLAAQFNVPLLFEAFADRCYTDDGLLQSRNRQGAVFTEHSQIINQAIQLAQQGSVTSNNGNIIKLKADTLCVHGDNAQSIEAIARIKLALTANKE